MEGLDSVIERKNEVLTGKATQIQPFAPLLTKVRFHLFELENFFFMFYTLKSVKIKKIEDCLLNRAQINI